MTMWQAFQMGGWAMWFILVFGVLAVYASARFAVRGEESLENFGRWMLLTTALAAGFGFSAGMIAVSQHVTTRVHAHEQRVATFIEGFGEASNCVALGLLMCTLSSLLMAIGSRRYTR